MRGGQLDVSRRQLYALSRLVICCSGLLQWITCTVYERQAALLDRPFTGAVLPYLGRQRTNRLRKCLCQYPKLPHTCVKAAGRHDRHRAQASRVEGPCMRGPMIVRCAPCCPHVRAPVRYTATAATKPQGYTATRVHEGAAGRKAQLRLTAHR